MNKFRSNRLKLSLSLLALFVWLILPVAADEGMWPYNLVPKDYLAKKYNFKVTDDWLNHLRLASVAFGGASGSFVSPDGLVLTNHHVGRGAIQNLSTPERDLIKNGFYARTRDEELKCPGMVLSVLQEIEDVTERVLAAEKPGMSPQEVMAARDKAIAEIQKEATEKSGLRCQVVSLYSGSMYNLYKYKTYNDVRLVFAVENDIAFFGGDPDNFTYPRYDLDVSIFRIYENGKPLKTKDYLKWSTTPLKEGDLVFCSGNPGSTGRLLTYDQLLFLRDVSYPFTIDNLKRRQAILHEYASRGPEQERIARNTIFGIENSLKATIGYQSGLLDKDLMARKLAEEQQIRQAVTANPELAKEYGQAWDEIAQAQKEFASFFKQYQFFERGNAFNTVYFNMARSMVRMASMRDAQGRATGAGAGRMMGESRPVPDDFEILKLTDSLKQLKEQLPDQQETKWLLGCRSPEEVASELITKTRLKDPEYRKELMEGGSEAIYMSDDPMIKLALMIEPVARGLRERYENKVRAVEVKNGTLVARALFKIKGTSIPPDATGTLRLSFGVVKGYMENGKKIPFHTTFAGLYEKAQRFNFKPPYSLPEIWLKKKAALNLNTPLNFVATIDSIGGNSGSPVVNRKGEFVGTLFDGNIQSLPTRFVYEEKVARSVMVDGQALIEALLKIYDAKPLADELLGRLPTR
ncbi:MAG TPA: S46 family peptidase [Candidatus Saccharicenans sp.]|nr:S46 family peptidase [Candidatus Saccharicenans sp.]HPC88381.1 S46 family peptidase [Candidatus Saccharicenans sp.]